jgi:hypothetical protein
MSNVVPISKRNIALGRRFGPPSSPRSFPNVWSTTTLGQVSAMQLEADAIENDRCSLFTADRAPACSSSKYSTSTCRLGLFFADWRGRNG